MGRVVRNTRLDSMIGADHHNGLYYLNLFTGMAPWAPPFIPAPIPPGLAPTPASFHLVAACTDHSLGVEPKINATVLAEGAPVVSKNHTATRVIHIPPGGNVLIVLVIAMGQSAWKLAVGRVLGPEGPLACTAAGPVGFTINCGDPCSAPTGLAISNNSVHLDATGDDWGVCGLEWLVTAAIELFLSWFFSKAADVAKKLIARKLVNRLLASQIANEAADEATKRALGPTKSEFLKKYMSAPLSKASPERVERLRKYLEKEATDAAKKALSTTEDVVKPNLPSGIMHATEATVGAAENDSGNKANEIVDDWIPDDTDPATHAKTSKDPKP